MFNCAFTLFRDLFFFCFGRYMHPAESSYPCVDFYFRTGRELIKFRFRFDLYAVLLKKNNNRIFERWNGARFDLIEMHKKLAFSWDFLWFLALFLLSPPSLANKSINKNWIFPLWTAKCPLNGLLDSYLKSNWRSHFELVFFVSFWQMDDGKTPQKEKKLLKCSFYLFFHFIYCDSIVLFMSSLWIFFPSSFFPSIYLHNNCSLYLCRK